MYTESALPSPEEENKTEQKPNPNAARERFDRQFKEANTQAEQDIKDGRPLRPFDDLPLLPSSEGPVADHLQPEAEVISLDEARENKDKEDNE